MRKSIFKDKEELRLIINQDALLTVKDFIELHENIVVLLKEEYESIKKNIKKSNIIFDKIPNFSEKVRIQLSNSEIVDFTYLPAWVYNRDAAPNDNFITINKLIKKDKNVISFLVEFNQASKKRKIKLERISFGNRLHIWRNKFGLGKTTKAILVPKKDEISITTNAFLFSFLISIGKDNVDSVRKYLQPTNKEAILDDDSLDYNHYIGFYYSNHHEPKIKNFLIEFSKQPLTDKSKNKEYRVRELGIHSNDTFNDNEILKGTATIRRDSVLFCNIDDTEDKYLNVTVVLNNDFSSEKGNKFITAGVQGFSTHGYIFQFGALLIKILKNERQLYLEQWKNNSIEIEKIITNKHLWVLELFLTLNKKANYILPYGKQHLTELRIDISSIRSLGNIEGVFRVWNFGDYAPDRINQSKLIIEKNGIATLYPYISSKDQEEGGVDFSEQKISFQISEVETGRVHLIGTSYFEKKIINVALFDFSDYLKDSEQKIIKGIFITMGYGNKGFTGNYTVMTKEKEEFEPRAFSKDEAQAYISGKPLYSKMHKMLYAIKEKKSWDNSSNEKNSKQSSKIDKK
ncbi:MAG: hypothetical protein ACI8RP_000681 [Urechidicola sp.]|jgi:hypothetical protein